MDVQENVIDFNFLTSGKKIYKYTVMIILNRPIHEDQFLKLREITDYTICADGAANNLYRLENK